MHMCMYEYTHMSAIDNIFSRACSRVNKTTPCRFARSSSSAENSTNLAKVGGAFASLSAG